MRHLINFIAVDTGITGHIAHYNEGNIQTYDCPDNAVDLVKLLNKIKPKRCFLELAHTGYYFSKVANFKLGCNYGTWLGCLAGKKIKTEVVYSKEWQKKYKDIKSELSIKEQVWLAMKIKYPELLGKEYKSWESHKSDALGIMTYGLEKI